MKKRPDSPLTSHPDCNEKQEIRNGLYRCNIIESALVQQVQKRLYCFYSNSKLKTVGVGIKLKSSGVLRGVARELSPLFPACDTCEVAGSVVDLSCATCSPPNFKFQAWHLDNFGCGQ